MPMNETSALKTEFENKGYIQLPKFFSDDEIAELQEEIIKAAGLLEKKSGLNKDNMIFHSNVFLKSQYLQEFVSQEKIIRIIQDIMETDFWVRWDQCVAKAPGGAAFPWHQDNAYNRLHNEHFQFWIGITEMTEENGGLWLQPGSHRLGLLPHEMRENHQVCTELPGEGVFVKADKGDVILFSSFMLHHTKRNNSDADRWAYVVEYMSTEHYDPLALPPFFVVTENGQSHPHFAQTYKGHASLTNRMKYVGPQLKESSRRLAGKLKRNTSRALKKIVGMSPRTGQEDQRTTTAEEDAKNAEKNGTDE